jgi:hypothetical protein
LNPKFLQPDLQNPVPLGREIKSPFQRLFCAMPKKNLLLTDTTWKSLMKKREEKRMESPSDLAGKYFRKVLLTIGKTSMLLFRINKILQQNTKVISI